MDDQPMIRFSTLEARLQYTSISITELAELRRRLALCEAFVEAWDTHRDMAVFGDTGDEVDIARAALDWLPEGGE